MDHTRGGLLSLMFNDDGADSSHGTSEAGSRGTQGTSEEGSRGTGGARREWRDNALRFLYDLASSFYWEYDRKAFREANWRLFAREMNIQFSEEPQRTWKQTRDK